MILVGNIWRARAGGGRWSESDHRRGAATAVCPLKNRIVCRVHVVESFLRVELRAKVRWRGSRLGTVCGSGTESLARVISLLFRTRDAIERAVFVYLQR